MYVDQKLLLQMAGRSGCHLSKCWDSGTGLLAFGCLMLAMPCHCLALKVQVAMMIPPLFLWLLLMIAALSLLSVCLFICLAGM